MRAGSYSVHVSTRNLYFLCKGTNTELINPPFPWRKNCFFVFRKYLQSNSVTRGHHSTNFRKFQPLPRVYWDGVSVYIFAGRLPIVIRANPLFSSHSLRCFICTYYKHHFKWRSCIYWLLFSVEFIFYTLL